MSDSTAVRLPLPGGDGRPAATAGAYRPELSRALGELHAAAVKRRNLDPATTEIVRLRCAVWHNCRRCRSLRSVINGERVIDESVAEQIHDYERSDIAERHKVALRLADAFMTVPGAIDETLRRQVHEHFSDDEVVEMLLDIVAWTQQKPQVALALDIPPSQLTSLEFDETGRHSVGTTPFRASDG